MRIKGVIDDEIRKKITPGENGKTRLASPFFSCRAHFEQGEEEVGNRLIGID
jgi:hypothetical protein